MYNQRNKTKQKNLQLGFDKANHKQVPKYRRIVVHANFQFQTKNSVWIGYSHKIKTRSDSSQKQKPTLAIL
jgi:hypothetical protein